MEIQEVLQTRGSVYANFKQQKFIVWFDKEEDAKEFYNSVPASVIWRDIQQPDSELAIMLGIGRKNARMWRVDFIGTYEVVDREGNEPSESAITHGKLKSKIAQAKTFKKFADKVAALNSVESN